MLEAISVDLDTMIEDKIGRTNLSIISNLVNDSTTYHQFEDSLFSTNKYIIDNFFKRFFSDSDLIEEIQSGYRCFSNIMTFEINMVYREWYGKEEEFVSKTIIDDDLIKYVKSKYPYYYSRLISITRFQLKERILHPLIWKKITQRR
jgi:hypothetical protein